jgi:putative transcriptional regulator
LSSLLENRIRVLRAAWQLSQTDLALEIGVSRKTISTIEVGRFVPSTVIALKVARFFVDDRRSENAHARSSSVVTAIARSCSSRTARREIEIHAVLGKHCAAEVSPYAARRPDGAHRLIRFGGVDTVVRNAVQEAERREVLDRGIASVHGDVDIPHAAGRQELRGGRYGGRRKIDDEAVA